MAVAWLPRGLRFQDAELAAPRTSAAPGQRAMNVTWWLTLAPLLSVPSFQVTTLPCPEQPVVQLTLPSPAAARSLW